MNYIIFAVVILLGCRSSTVQEKDELIEFSELRYNDNKLLLSTDQLNQMFKIEPMIDSLESFKEPRQTSYFYFYKLNESSISFKVNKANSSAIINDAIFADSNLKIDYSNFIFSNNTSFNDLKKIFPEIISKYVENGEGKYIDYENGEQVGFKYKIPIRSNRTERDFFEFEFSESGNLVSLTYNE